MRVSAEAPSEAQVLQWFAVRIENQGFLARAEDRDEALRYAFLVLGEEEDKAQELATSIYHPERVFQRIIDSEHGSRRQAFRTGNAWHLQPGSERVFLNDKGEKVERPDDLNV